MGTHYRKTHQLLILLLFLALSATRAQNLTTESSPLPLHEPPIAAEQEKSRIIIVFRVRTCIFPFMEKTLIHTTTHRMHLLYSVSEQCALAPHSLSSLLLLVLAFLQSAILAQKHARESIPQPSLDFQANSQKINLKVFKNACQVLLPTKNSISLFKKLKMKHHYIHFCTH